MAARAVLPEPAHAPGLGRLVMQVSRELRTLADRQLAPLGLTMQQAELVIATFLHGEKGSRHLTSLVLTDEAGVSRLVDRLEAKGLVRRRPSPRDRRSRALELTPAGRAVVARMRRRRAVVDQRLREGISADDIAATRDVLLRVLDNIARAARAVA
ncbi:MAG: winged helix-turn-helix transcriptional regulator [Chloroflexi bacterium]|nr:MAG: winged helix-turn-helix transcriptional regulator [Chloroflexota bacterium]TMB76411.1 MAG: winged helix-turn-helix transcriptional regulator [Chloroflexota bacterium]TMB93774.1 MAG: winged helix-turn-helix transcriptional regulator [Chloroflexota bacterium]TMC30819.1 MAG: winged helix-turn-helix transcriptional regulator [Chloroflexota bacterium]TMC33191.1 MAG: winged helix-turn-helix transcriptional regulator [Chloroflexota bacterium]